MRIVAIALLAAAWIFSGCAGSDAKNPVAPTSQVAIQTGTAGNRHLWGMWDVNISADRRAVEVSPIRNADLHLNVLGFSKPSRASHVSRFPTCKSPDRMSFRST